MHDINIFRVVLWFLLRFKSFKVLISNFDILNLFFHTESSVDKIEYVFREVVGIFN